MKLNKTIGTLQFFALMFIIMHLSLVKNYEKIIF